MKGSSLMIVFVVLFVGVTHSLPMKNNEVEDLVFRTNDLGRLNPYSDEDANLYAERSLDPIGGGNLIRSINYNDLNDGLIRGRQHVRRSALPQGFDNDWNIVAERRNSYRYSWPKYGSVHTNFRRALDSIGGGHLLKRALDSIGGDNGITEILEKGRFRGRRLPMNPILYDYYMSALDAAYGRRDDQSMDMSDRREMIKKNFDEIDRTGFKHLKRNFDEIDRVGFSELKRNV